MIPDDIIFVKHGDKYSAEHVNRLYSQLIQYYPDARYHCYTEHPQGIDTRVNIIWCFNKPTLKLWWNKLAMFSEDFPIQNGRKCLFFDLDMNITSDFTKYIQWDGLTILEAYWKRNMFMRKHAYDVKINSSVITWTAGEQTHIWDRFMTNRDYFMRKYKGIDRFLVHENIQFNTFKHGIVNSVANENIEAPIQMYNGIDYELSRNSL